MKNRVALKWVDRYAKCELIEVELDLPEEFTDGEMMKQVWDRTEFVEGLRVSSPEQIRQEVLKARGAGGRSGPA